MKVKIPYLKYNNPINENQLDEIIGLLNVEQGDQIIDIGGGTGATLERMIAKSGAIGTLIDNDQRLIKQCEAAYPKLLSGGRLVLVNEDAKAYMERVDHGSVDCIVCLGATYIFKDYLSFLKAVHPYLKPGGFLLVGDQFWAQKPAEAYLEILGCQESECGYHPDNIEKAEEMGYVYLYSHIASRQDWDTFEGKYFLEEEIKAQSKPEKEREDFLKRLRSFRKAQYRYGRATMGFGLYLFQKLLQ